MTYVVDTSALIRLYIPDGPVPDALESALVGVECGNDVLMAPELLLAEVGQVLLKKRLVGALSEEELVEIAEEIERLPIRLFSHQGHLVPAFQLARDVGLTVYDALFLHLARIHSAKLITADELLAGAARQLSL